MNIVWGIELSSTPWWGILKAAAPTHLGQFTLHCLLSQLTKLAYTKCYLSLLMHHMSCAFSMSRRNWYCTQRSYQSLFSRKYSESLMQIVKKLIFSAAEDRVLPSPDRRSWGRASPRTAAPSRTTVTRTTTMMVTTRTTMTGRTSGRILRAAAKEVNIHHEFC